VRAKLADQSSSRAVEASAAQLDLLDFCYYIRVPCCLGSVRQDMLFFAQHAASAVFQLWSSIYCPRFLLLAALQSVCLVRCLDSFTGSLGLGQFSCTGNWPGLHLTVVIAVACSQRHSGSSLSSASRIRSFLRVICW
jgi:hypothetical protein